MANLFENTLLILKSDYVQKRKMILLKLLQHDFQIQCHRKLLFTPEHAAEFYKDLCEEEGFMFQVILLSKGNSEAFILTKENAVQDLINTLICHFGTSMEMERNVHATQRVEDVQREIMFIFPNYIHEPIPFFERGLFCRKTLIAPLVNELYEITQGAEIEGEATPQWRVKLAEWLVMNNKMLPRVSNQCSTKPTTRHEDKGQQVTLFRDESRHGRAGAAAVSRAGSPPVSLSSIGSSMIMSSSTCVSCPCFDDTDQCKQPPPASPTKAEFLQIIKAKTQEPPKLEEERPQEHGEGLHWIEASSEHCSEDAHLMEEQEPELESPIPEWQSVHGDEAAIVVEDAD